MDLRSDCIGHRLIANCSKIRDEPPDRWRDLFKTLADGCRSTGNGECHERHPRARRCQKTWQAGVLRNYFCTTIIAVITGLIIVNIVDPGKGIDKKLVEDARKDGEEQVANAGGKTGRKIEWHNVTGDRSQTSGESKNISVPEDGRWNVKIFIDQIGVATQPAQAIVKWSVDGNRFPPNYQPSA